MLACHGGHERHWAPLLRLVVAASTSRATSLVLLSSPLLLLLSFASSSMLFRFHCTTCQSRSSSSIFSAYRHSPSLPPFSSILPLPPHEPASVLARSDRLRPGLPARPPAARLACMFAHAAYLAPRLRLPVPAAHAPCAPPSPLAAGWLSCPRCKPLVTAFFIFSF